MTKQTIEEQANEKQRLQFDFSKPAVDRLDELVERLNASSRAEIVRRALEVFDYLTIQKKDGAEIVVKLRTPEGKEEVVRVLGF